MEDKKELMFFDWVVIDNCNLNCSYCVNSGEYSQKPRNEMKYIQGIEVDIAKKVVELSKISDNIIVNFSGGEPLIANKIKDVIEIFCKAKNIEMHLITNGILLDEISEYVHKIRYIIISLHISYRNDEGIEHLINMVNKFKNDTELVLMQVDHGLDNKDMNNLARISDMTGLDVKFQVYNPPWTEKGKIDDEEKVGMKNFVKSHGKRCSLGNIFFLLLPDGTFCYDLWCFDRSSKTGNFLINILENKDKLFPKGFKKCPKKYCGCNYNTHGFVFPTYLSICKKLGYKKSEIFSAESRTSISIAKAKLLSLKMKLRI